MPLTVKEGFGYLHLGVYFSGILDVGKKILGNDKRMIEREKIAHTTLRSALEYQNGCTYGEQI